MNTIACRLILALSAALLAAAGPVDAAEALLVKNAMLITMKPGQEKPFSGYFTVGDDGRITALAAGEAPAELTADRVIDASGKIIGPGFISGHSHIYMSPLRGLATDQTLYGWVNGFGPFTNRATADDLYWFSLHGSIDFLRNGITTAYDFTHSGAVATPAVGLGEKVPPPTLKPGPYEENQIKAKTDAHLRFIDSVGLPEFGTHDEVIARLGTLLDWVKTTQAENPYLLKMAISGGLQRAPTKETADLEVRAMRTFHLINQSHFLESPERVTEQQQKFAWYEEAGALGPDFIFGHFIQTTPDIVRRAAQAGAHMCWQPTSNSRLASGIADIPLYEAMGMKVAVGLDDQSCTDISDPFQNLRIGMALIRTKYKDAKAMSTYHMLYLHTLGTADVLGIADQVGSLEPGKFADFILVDPRAPDTGPVHDVLGTYVLACGLRNLKQVYVGGELIVDGERHLKQDESVVRREVDTRIARLAAENELTLAMP
jgi:5-methylthioadenosine/S-adenosylhomocysteine deaminase